MVGMQPLSGDEMWNVAWNLACMWAGGKLSSVFCEEIGGVLMGVCYNDCNIENKRIPTKLVICCGS